MQVNTTVSNQVLYGRDRRKTKVGLLLGGILFLISYLFW